MTMDKHAENGPTRKKSARKDKKDAYMHNIKKSKTKQNTVHLAQQPPIPHVTCANGDKLLKSCEN